MKGRLADPKKLTIPFWFTFPIRISTEAGVTLSGNALITALLVPLPSRSLAVVVAVNWPIVTPELKLLLKLDAYPQKSRGVYAISLKMKVNGWECIVTSKINDLGSWF